MSDKHDLVIRIQDKEYCLTLDAKKEKFTKGKILKTALGKDTIAKVISNAIQRGAHGGEFKFLRGKKYVLLRWDFDN